MRSCFIVPSRKKLYNHPYSLQPSNKNAISLITRY